MDGIDISRWQAGMDLARVPHDFVIIKATEGNGYTDPEFARFAKASRGTLRGFYHFARADLNPGTGGAKREADWFVKVITPHLDGDTIVVLDWEAGSLKKGTAWAKVWLDRVREATGTTPLVYTSSSVTRSYDWSQIAPTYPLWCASYGTNPVRDGYATVPRPSVAHWRAVSIHQYGSRGRLPGYSGNLDVNRAYIDRDQWRAWAVGSSHQEAPTVRMVSPAEGRITSTYGRRDPIPGVTTANFHAGLDIANDTGTPIYAAYAGTVELAGANIVKYRSGNGILIRNPDGEAQYYGHLDKIRVRVGQKVAMGERIGDMGATGNVTGPHLHFECWSGRTQDTTRDPLIDFRHWGITPGSTPHPPTDTEDWLTMATQQDVEAAVWNVLNRQIAVGGTTGKRHGDTAPLYALIRDGAYTLDVGRAERAQILTQLATLTANIDGTISAEDVAAQVASLLLPDLAQTITDAIDEAPDRDADQIAAAVTAQIGARLNPTTTDPVTED